MRKLIVKIADKSGERLERISLRTKVLGIGRAWDSDIIVQDRFVDPDHLSLSLGEGDQLHIADLNTTNGSLVSGRSIRNNSVSYRLGDKIRIGDTTLQIFDQAIGVGVTAIRSSWFLLTDRFRSWPALLSLTLLMAILHLVSNWMFASKPVSLNEAVSIVLQVLIVTAVWSLLLGFTSKLIRGESNLRAFWILGCLALILLEVVNFSVTVVRFNLQDNQLGGLISMTVFCAVGWLVLVGVLSYATHMRQSSQWLFAGALVLTILLLVKSDDLLKQEHERWSAESQTEMSTLPPAFLLRSPVTSSQFLQDTDALFEFDLSTAAD